MRLLLLIALGTLSGCASVYPTVNHQGETVMKVSGQNLDQVRAKMRDYCGGKFHTWNSDFSSSKSFVASSSCSGGGCTSMATPVTNSTVTMNFACGGSVYDGLTDAEKREFRNGWDSLRTIGVIPDTVRWIQKYGKFLKPVEPI